VAQFWIAVEPFWKLLLLGTVGAPVANKVMVARTAALLDAGVGDGLPEKVPASSACVSDGQLAAAFTAPAYTVRVQMSALRALFEQQRAEHSFCKLAAGMTVICLRRKCAGLLIAVHTSAHGEQFASMLPFQVGALRHGTVAVMLKFCLLLPVTDMVQLSLPACRAAFQSMSSAVLVPLAPWCARAIDAAIRDLFQCRTLLSTLAAAQANMSFCASLKDPTTKAKLKAKRSKMFLYIFRALQACAHGILALGIPACHENGTYAPRVDELVRACGNKVLTACSDANWQCRGASGLSWIALLLTACTFPLRVPRQVALQFQDGTQSPAEVARLFEVRTAVSRACLMSCPSCVSFVLRSHM
jgi:hypothetical protein